MAVFLSQSHLGLEVPRWPQAHVGADYWLGHFGSHLIDHFPEDQTGVLHRTVTSGAKRVRRDISSQVL